MGMGISVENMKEEKYFRKFMNSPLKYLTKSILKKRIEEAKQNHPTQLVNDEITMLDLLNELPIIAQKEEVGFMFYSSYSEEVNTHILPSLLKRCLVLDANKNLQVEKTRDDIQMGYQWYDKCLDALTKVELRSKEIVLEKNHKTDGEIAEWVLNLERGTVVDAFIKKYEDKLSCGDCELTYECKEFHISLAYVQDPRGAGCGPMNWAVLGSLHVKNKNDNQCIESLNTCNISYHVYKRCTLIYSNQAKFDSFHHQKGEPGIE